MIVVDASVLANAVADDGQAGHVARARLAAERGAAIPHLADVETVAVLRKRWLGNDITARRFRSAIDDLATLPLARFPTGRLMVRAFELRSAITAYDATYVGLAEGLGCVLVTADRRLARAHGVRCSIEVLHV